MKLNKELVQEYSTGRIFNTKGEINMDTLAYFCIGATWGFLTMQSIINLCKGDHNYQVYLPALVMQYPYFLILFGNS